MMSQTIGNTKHCRQLVDELSLLLLIYVRSRFHGFRYGLVSNLGILFYYFFYNFFFGLLSYLGEDTQILENTEDI